MRIFRTSFPKRRETLIVFDPLADLEPGEVFILRLKELEKAPSPFGLIEELPGLCDCLEADVLKEAVRPGTDRGVACAGLCKLPLVIEVDVCVV